MRFFLRHAQAGFSFSSKDKCGSLGVATFIATLLIALPGKAGFITVSPELAPVLDESAQVLRLSGRVTNRGDESAREVSLEFPSLNRRFKITDVMVVNTPHDVNLEFSFQDLGIQKKGQYTLAYRVLYHDNNMYPFSNVQLLDLVFGLVPARALRMAFDLDGKKTLNVQSELESELEIESIAEQDINIENVLLVGPIEVSAKLEDDPPKTLKPGEKKELDFEVENKSALAGSNYYFAAIASGTRGEYHFSETIATNILIEKPIEKMRSYVLFSLAAIGGVIAIGGSIMTIRKKKSQ